MGPALCSERQRAFVADPSRYRIACTGRRAGKTVGDAILLLWAANTGKPGNYLYVTLSRLNAKRIIWQTLRQYAETHSMRAEFNESELYVKLANGSIIYLSGAKDASEIEKFRGLSLAGVVIDEAQAFRPYLQQLIDDILIPCLWDTRGWLCITGTPGPVMAGPFWDAWASDKWSRHHWTVLDNPHLDGLLVLKEERERRGIDESDPTYRREALGEWCEDPNALVFRYEAARNHYETAPALSHHVIGVDLGYHDADAVAVLGWADDSPDVYLVDEYLARREGYTDLIERGVDPFWKKYQPETVWWDFGGMGVKAQEEIRRRWPHLPSFAAEKSRKLEHIALVNDALRTGRLRAKKDSAFAQDCKLVTWEVSGQKVSDAYHSDITDAVLYAYRAASAYLYRPEVERERVDPATAHWSGREAAAKKRQEADSWLEDAALTLGIE